MRVLIAEDDTDIRELLHDLLQHKGRSVSAARDGEEAWRIFEESRSILHELGDTDAADQVLNGLGQVAGFRGDYVGARACFERVIAVEPDGIIV